MLSLKAKRRMKRELSTEKASVHIGKDGASQKIIDEIDRQLQEKEMLKVKILKTALEKNETKTIANETAQRTDSTLIDVRGHTFTLYKRKKPRK